jgi:hypothetical protein
MLDQAFAWFLVTYQEEFRRGNVAAFETLVFLSVAHLFGFYNPKALADYLQTSPQRLYEQLKTFSLYTLQELLIRFQVKQAVERLRPILEKSDATRSRAGVSLAADDSVIDRIGQKLRCVYHWYSGRWKQIVNGQDLLGIVLTIEGVAFPLALRYCAKQGRANTDKPSLLIAMLTRLKAEFEQQGIDLTVFPITLDSWYVSKGLREELYRLGFRKILLAGKGSYTFTIGQKKQVASAWKKDLNLAPSQWGIDVPALRVEAQSPTFGKQVLFFFQKSTSRSYYLMDFSSPHLRGAEIWHIWKQHHGVEVFWKILKSIFKIQAMQLPGDGLYTGLLIKVLAYLLAIRIQTQRAFSKFTLIQLMRKIQREEDLKTLWMEHFHLPIPAT